MDVSHSNPINFINVYTSIRDEQGVSMKEGYYWIQYNGGRQIAYYIPEVIHDLDSGKTIIAAWYVTQGDDLCNNGEVEVLTGPIEEPAP
jgi:hypothetical protein